MQMIDPDTVRYSIQVTLLFIDQKTPPRWSRRLSLSAVFLFIRYDAAKVRAGSVPAQRFALCFHVSNYLFAQLHGVGVNVH